MNNQSNATSIVTVPAKPRVVLLDDLPTSEDKFGPHQRLANSIADLITQESGGKAIAIEGGWGSGKSSVIKLIQQNLKDKKDFHIIQFDAWTHEGDPLRRTYLESLILSLKLDKWLNQLPWNDTLEEIANRRKVTTTKITPKPTALGKSIAISLLLVPLGTAILGVAIRVFTTSASSQSSNLLTWQLWGLVVTGIILSISPLIVLIKHGICKTAQKCWRCLRKLIRRPNLPPLAPLDWSFLIGKSVNETTTESTESPNPTSIEFDSYFRKAMFDALEGYPDRRIILVLDNLDRIEPASAISLWSTLQTFLQERDHISAPWYKQLWTIIPYDPAVMSRLWKNYDSQNSSTSTSTNSSFLDKSFQIRFSVPPPVLSEWKNYLNTLLARAFPDHDRTDRHMAYRIYNEWKRENSAHPTPRELKLFVNQTGAIVRQWGHEFPFSHAAYYALYCKDTGEAISQLQKGTIPSQNAKFLLGETLTSSLAGMVFNVKASKGMEFLLSDLIEQSVAISDHQSLTRMRDSHEDGFWPVLELVISKESVSAETSWLGAACQCFKDSEITKNSTTDSEEIIKYIRNAVLRMKRWIPIKKSSARECISVIQYFNDNEITKHILDSANKQINNLKEKIDSNKLPEGITSLSLLIDTAKATSPELADGQSFVLPCEADDWLNAVGLVLSEGLDPKLFNIIKSNSTDEIIGENLASRIALGNPDSKLVQTIEAIGSFMNDAALSQITDSIKKRFEAGAAASTAEVELLARTLIRINKNSQAICAPIFSDLASQGHIAHHLFTGTDSIRCKSICAYWILRIDPKITNQPSIGNSSNGYAILTALLKTPDKTFVADFFAFASEELLYTDILSMAEQIGFPNPFVTNLIKHISQSSEASVFFANEVIISHWKEIESCLESGEEDSAFKLLLEELSSTNKLCEEFYRRPLDFSYNDLPLYWKILEKNKANQEFILWCKKGIEMMSKAQWVADFSSDFDACWLAIRLDDLDANVVLRTAAADALDEHASSLISGSHEPEDAVSDEWNVFIELLEAPVKKSLIERILRIAIDARGAIPANFFTLYGDQIFSLDVIKSNQRVVVDLFSSLVREKNLNGLKHLSKFAEMEPDFLSSIGHEFNHGEFETRISDCLSELSDNEVDKLIQQIAVFWNIQPKPPVVSDNEA